MRNGSVPLVRREDEGVLGMDTAQIWAVIGVLAAGFFGMLTITSTFFVRVLRAEIGGVRAEIGGVRAEVSGVRAELRGELEAVRAEMRGELAALRAEIAGLRAEMDARFQAVEARLDGVDRDVQFLMRRESDRA